MQAPKKHVSQSTSLSPKAPDPSNTADQYHIDFGYSIAKGTKLEKYFLLIRLLDRDFLWAMPTTALSSPELILQDFVDATGIAPTTIRCDNKFGDNQSLGIWCRKYGATLQPTPAYNHTMAAKIEGSVRITKEHLSCITKAAHTPLRFWPY